jgi:hypothetical protein
MTTTFVDVRAVEGGCRVKTKDGQRVFLVPGDNKVELDGFEGTWDYDPEAQTVTIRSVQAIPGAAKLVKRSKLSLPKTIRGKQ